MAPRYLVKNTWAVALLALALSGAACGEDTLPTDESDDSSESDDDDDAKPDAKVARKNDAGKGKVDAGTKPTTPPEEDDDGDDDSDDDDDVAPPQGMTDARVVATPDAGGSKADASTSAPDAATAGEKADLGKGDGKDVICIGDSWMSLIGTGIQQSLVKVSGQRYRTYGVAGTMLLNGQIPNQYASAKRADPDIKTVVMTGGGNDILIAGGDPKTTIPKIAARLDELWTEMGKDGVKDVVYVEYSKGGRNGDDVQLGIDTVGPVCMNHKAVRCHFMLSDPIIMMMLADGIHPTSAGYDKLGKAVHELMIKEGMRR